MKNMVDAKRTLLIVEDDPSIAMGLVMNLEAEGYRVLSSESGSEGLDLAREQHFDLLILDIMLPGLNGFEILQTLRAENNLTPVILLSAKGAEMDKVMGLELGAEDYITKPFSLAELLARVKAVLRRDAIARKERSSMMFDDLKINVATREVHLRKKRIELTATEFDILHCLANAEGRVLSRDQIQNAVWGHDHHGTTRTIDNFILQLRHKLEDDVTQPRFILTVRGVGYRFGFS